MLLHSLTSRTSRPSCFIKRAPINLHHQDVFGILHVRASQNIPHGCILHYSAFLCHAQKVGGMLECYHKASSLTFTIQDGPESGQTVPHVHIHIVPRKGGDFERNDEIYDAINEKEKELKKNLDLDQERRDRSLEEMAQEADEYRKIL
ncbi:hypothetical protein CIPAW_14G047000 [Carya illinoinensis]|uniref:HIT domain-containing protein n=1 Tax=Carya illinoinensis TaxID=32201 RepID=A0A8T1NJ28_CARIL|nr:hypothetical protein CIPAW_14G047000 [Carya illinoinensis]